MSSNCQVSQLILDKVLLSNDCYGRLYNEKQISCELCAAKNMCKDLRHAKKK